AVAYDEDLADRIRGLVAGEKGLSEKKMFGGLAFLIGGNMAVAASGQGGILVRVDPAASEKLVSTTKAHPMVMRGRAMEGWLRVDADHLREKRQLAKWVERGVTYARSLPPKSSRCRSLQEELLERRNELRRVHVVSLALQEADPAVRVRL